MANPRKFSEKIALHTTRQAEETAAFDKIMKEVHSVTSKDDPGGQPQGAASPGAGSPGGCGGGIGTAIGPYRAGARARSPVGPIRRPHDRRLDTSPYSGPYLSPPADSGWRRTNSDSALHQSAMQGVSMDRGDPSNRGSWSMLPTMNGPDRSHDGRSRSSRDLPRVPGLPGIHIYPSAPMPNQIPIGNNTGSLPDLTNMDFTSPIHAPLDQDQDSSPYSSNHLSVPVNSRYPHRHMRQNVDNKNIIQDGTAEYTQLGSIPGLYQQQQCPPTSPSPTLQQGAGYRSPHRPSPQSSPGLGGRHSAPCSPGGGGGGGGPSSPLSPDYQLFGQHTAAAQFHQHFEQLSMLDTPVSSAPIPFADPSPAGAQPVVAQSLPDASTLAELELEAARYAYSQSQPPPAYPAQQSPGLQQGPNTPPSVPEIVLTDFSADDITRQDFDQQLDLFGTTEEALREGLGSLDFDDFQILNTQLLGSVVPESVEERFRLERS